MHRPAKQTASSPSSIAKKCTQPKASAGSTTPRSIPELGATGLMNVENGFEPWDLEKLDPKRHPLRQYDKQLREADEKTHRFA
jgi:hypothetical protein